MNNFKKLLSVPLFWTNVVTAVVMFVLVASIVFGWTNPTLPPPQGSGAIGIDANEDVTFSTKVTVNPGTRRQLKNIGTPTHDNDVATRGWVNGLLGQQTGGKTLITLWGYCQSDAGNISCDPGEGTPVCSGPGSPLDPTGTGGVTQAYKGYGPWVYTDDRVGGEGSVSAVKTVDSIPVCSAGGSYAYVDVAAGGYPAGPGSTGIFGYRATWFDSGSPTQILNANTCRVCVLDGGYQPVGGN